jgi:hypothetical protein
VARYYQGDHSELQILAAGVGKAFEGVTVEDFEARAAAFVRAGRNPSLDRPYLGCAYAPMVELLGYLAANGFTNWIVSGGGRDFVRPVSGELYGIPRERVIGSSATLAFRPGPHGGTIVHEAALEVLEDGLRKPVAIWSHAGRRPLLAAGNSNGDVAMLQFAAHPRLPSLRLLVRHDDGAREFDDAAGAEAALTMAEADGWTVVSMAADWARVF